MPIYLATPLIESSEPLNQAVIDSIEEKNRYTLQANRGWLIKYDGTTVELSNHLGITGKQKGESSFVGSAMITLVTAYYGRGPTDMWEWLKIRMEQ